MDDMATEEGLPAECVVSLYDKSECLLGLRDPALFWPTLFLSIAFVVFLIWITGGFKRDKTIKWKSSSLYKKDDE